MEAANNCKRELFFEALKHSRNKTVLKSFISTIRVENFKNKSFEEIFLEISKGKIHKKIGDLAIYDISSDIFRSHGGIIKKVYIIGNGPKRAVRLLGLKTKVDPTIHQRFVEIGVILEKLSLPPTDDGDLLETYICQWQKTMNSSSSRDPEPFSNCSRPSSAVLCA